MGTPIAWNSAVVLFGWRPARFSTAPSNPEQVANAAIFFVEQKAGVESVSKFLKAIGPAQSFKQLIKNNLGLNEIQFKQQWQDWLKQLYAQGS